MAGVIWYTYTPDILEKLHVKRLPGLGIALIVSAMRVWFGAARIRYLAEKKLSWMGALRTMLAWDFTSAVTPSTIGGAPMATYAMSKEGLRLGESTAIVLFGVLLDQIWFAMAIPILLIAGLFYEVVPPDIGLLGEFSMLLLYIGLLSYASLLAYGVLVNPTAIKRIVKFIFRLPILNRFSDKINEEAENLESYAHEMRKKPFSFILKAYGLTVMTWLTRISLATIVVLSMLPADPVLSSFRSLAMNLTFLIVPTPGGSGGVEVLFVLFQGPLMRGDKAFIGLAVFAWRIISYYISVVLGMFAVSWYIRQSVINNQQDKTE